MRAFEFVANHGTRILEWTGAFFGLTGAWLVAANVPQSSYGFIAFLLSNVCMFGYGVKKRAWGLITMQLGLLASSVYGIAQWF